MAALAVVVLPAIVAWRLGLLASLVFLASGAWGLTTYATYWQAAHRAEVHARPPVDFTALDKAGRSAARETAGAITGVAKIVGWLPMAATGLGGIVLGAVGRHRRRTHQGSGSTTSPDASR